jgi:hypothetical protein
MVMRMMVRMVMMMMMMMTMMMMSIIYSYRLSSEENAALTELVPFTDEPVTPLELQTR